MSEQEIYGKLNEIFEDVLDEEDIQLTAEDSAETVDGWDSLAHINIVVSVENEFNFKFEMEEIVGMKQVGDMVKIIQEKMA